WGAAGSAPSTVDLKYYTGTNAPSLLPSKTQFNAYYQVTPLSGSGYSYNISLSYDSSMLGNVSSSANSRMARYKSPSWNLITASSADAVNGILMETPSLAANTLPGNFTGTDVSNPLPVELINFTANAV